MIHLPPHIKIIDIEQGSQEWHNLRSRYIGSSDCAAILKEGRKSRLRLFHEKVGTWGRPDLDEIDQVFWGKVEESAILEMLQYYGYDGSYMRNFLDKVKVRKIWKTPGVVQNQKLPWLLGSLDAIEIGGMRLDNGQRIPFHYIDAKNTTSMAMNVYTEGIQREYIIQNTANMIQLECDYSELGFKIDGNKLRVKEVPLNRELGDIVAYQSEAFFQTVVKAKQAHAAAERFASEFRMAESEDAYRQFQNLEPDPDGTEDYEKFFKEKYRDSLIKERPATKFEHELIRNYHQYKAISDKMDSEIQEVKNTVLNIMAQDKLSKLIFGTNGGYVSASTSIRFGTTKPPENISTIKKVADIIIDQIKDGEFIK